MNNNNLFYLVIDINEDIADYIKNKYPNNFNSHNTFLRNIIPKLLETNHNINLSKETISKYESLSKKRNNFSYYIDKKHKEKFEHVATQNLRNLKQQATYYIYYIYSQLKEKKDFSELIQNHSITFVD